MLLRMLSRLIECGTQFNINKKENISRDFLIFIQKSMYFQIKSPFDARKEIHHHHKLSLLKFIQKNYSSGFMHLHFIIYRLEMLQTEVPSSWKLYI